MLSLLAAVVLSQTFQPGPSSPTWWDEGASVASPSGVLDFSTYSADLAPAPVDRSLYLNAADFAPGNTTWVDRAAGRVFTKSGAPLAWQGAPFYPEGFLEQPVAGEAGFTDSAYFRQGSLNDALDFAGDFMGCFRFVDGGTSGSPVVFSNGDGATGYYVQVHANGNGIFVDRWSATTTGNKVVPGGVNSFCLGRDGNNARVLLNGGEVVSGQGNPGAPGTGVNAVLGRYNATGYSFPGGILEATWSTKPATAANLRAMDLAAMNCRAAPCYPEDAQTVSHITFAGGELVDSKALSWTKIGSPTAASYPVAILPGQRTPLGQKAVQFTTGGVFTGPVPARLTSFAACATFSNTGTDANTYGLIARPGNYAVFRYYGILYFYSYKEGGGQDAVTVSIGTGWSKACWAYLKRTNGTSILRIAANGVSGTPVTNGGLITSNESYPNLNIGGGASGVGLEWTGRLAVYQEFPDGWEPTDADLARLSTIPATKPITNPIFVARNDVHSACCPVSNAACFELGPNAPCVTSKGLERTGVTTNILVQSNDFSAWTKTYDNAIRSPTVVVDQVEGPSGYVQADEVTFPASAGASTYSMVYQNFTGSAIQWSSGVWMRAKTGTASIFIEWWSGATVYAKRCDLTTTWTRCIGDSVLTAATWSMGIGYDRTVNNPASDLPAQTVYIVGAHAHPWIAATVPPFRSSGAASYSGPATMVTTQTPLRTTARFSVLFTGTLDLWNREFGAMWSVGNTDAANSATFYTRNNASVEAFVYNGGGLLRRQSSATGYTAGSEHSVLFSSRGGVLEFFSDWSILGGFYLGTGTGIPEAVLPTFNIGSGGVDNYSVTGYVKRIAICPSLAGCK